MLLPFHFQFELYVYLWTIYTRLVYSHRVCICKYIYSFIKRCYVCSIHSRNRIGKRNRNGKCYVISFLFFLFCFEWTRALLVVKKWNEIEYNKHFSTWYWNSNDTCILHNPHPKRNSPIFICMYKSLANIMSIMYSPFKWKRE